MRFHHLLFLKRAQKIDVLLRAFFFQRKKMHNAPFFLKKKNGKNENQKSLEPRSGLLFFRASHIHKKKGSAFEEKK